MAYRVSHPMQNALRQFGFYIDDAMCAEIENAGLAGGHSSFPRSYDDLTVVFV